MANHEENGQAASLEEVQAPPQPPPLDPEVEARRQAAFRLIRAFGDPVLRTRAGDVTRFDDSLREEVARMDRLMRDALGLGLAAPQLGVLHRLFVYRAGPDAPLVAVINPQLEWSSQDEEVAEEGCLSLPRVTMDVERPVHVRVSARDEHGAPMVQHEMDHLDGVLILDRTTREQRKEALRVLRGGDEHVHDAVGAGGEAAG
jgi:peptide deformylase